MPATLMDTKLDTPEDLLIAAQEVLHTGGWQQGMYGSFDDPSTPHCMTGALIQVNQTLGGVMSEPYLAAYFALEKACQEKAPTHTIAFVNDMFCADISDVDALFDRARELVGS